MSRINFVIIFFLISIYCSCDFHKPTNNTNSEEPLRLLWKYQYGSAIGLGIYSPPLLICDSLVFITGNENITCLKVCTGNAKWCSFVDDKVPIQSGQLLYDSNNIYGVHVQDFRAWDLNTGSEAWRYSMPEEDRGKLAYSYHSLYGSKIYLAIDNKMDIINLYNGIEYSINVKGKIHSALYKNNKIYCGQYWWERSDSGCIDFGRVTCFNAETGDSLWAFNTDGAGPMYSPLIIDNGVLYFGTVPSGDIGNYRFYAVNAGTGEKIWQTHSFATYYTMIEGNWIYGNDGGRVFALDKNTGNEFWRTELNAGAGTFELVYIDGYLYHPHGVGLYVLNAETGEIVHVEMPDDSSYFWHVAVSSDRVFVQSNHHLYCYEPYQSND